MRYLLFILTLVALAGCERPKESISTATPGAVVTNTPAPPGLTPIATGTVSPEGEWQAYWQRPDDRLPTRVHTECPEGARTEMDVTIRPGQRFEARPATECDTHPDYPDLPIVEVRLEDTIQGYAVQFGSFEPAPPTPEAGTLPGWRGR